MCKTTNREVPCRVCTSAGNTLTAGEAAGLNRESNRRSGGNLPPNKTLRRIRSSTVRASPSRQNARPRHITAGVATYMFRQPLIRHGPIFGGKTRNTQHRMLLRWLYFTGFISTGSATPFESDVEKLGGLSDQRATTNWTPSSLTVFFLLSASS